MRSRLLNIFLLLLLGFILGVNQLHHLKNRELTNKLDKAHNELVSVNASLNLAYTAFMKACVETRVETVGKEQGSLDYCRKKLEEYKKELNEILNPTQKKKPKKKKKKVSDNKLYYV